MNNQEKFDKIINILYDESHLHWKEVPVVDFIAFAKSKFGIDWTDVEINFITQTLLNDGYITINQGENPTYSLTTKGVQMKKKGDFVMM